MSGDDGLFDPPLVCASCDADRRTEQALATHDWRPDEDSNGRWYQFCSRCRLDPEQCRPNAFHGPIACQARVP